MRKKLKLFLWFSLLPHWIFIKYIKRNPELIEKIYSQQFYPFLFKTYSSIFDKIPFSLGDLIYLLILLLLIRSFIKVFSNDRYPFFKFIFDVGAFFSALAIVFNFSWGLNYYRLPLQKKLDIDTEYTQKDLEETIDSLISNVNKIHSSISESDSIPVIFPYNKKILLKKSLHRPSFLTKSEAFDNTKRKESIWSLPLSYMGFSGYINPFTLEAQINSKIPDINLIISSAHEAAHQMGYASEKEANFLAYFFSRKNPDPYTQYASLIFAIRYCHSTLFEIDQKKSKEKINKLNYGILQNIKESDSFWEEYKNPFQPVFKKTYDKFLKANSQEKGIKSYSEVVGLIINYEKTES